MAHENPPPDFDPRNFAVTANITAEDTYSLPISVDHGERLSVSVFGIFDAKATFQRWLDGTGWRDVPNFDGTVGWTAPTEQTYEADEGGYVRVGVKSGDYASGTVSVRIGRNK